MSSPSAAQHWQPKARVISRWSSATLNAMCVLAWVAQGCAPIGTLEPTGEVLAAVQGWLVSL